MRTFVIQFGGVLKGAIGGHYTHRKTVRAEHDAGAIAALYDTHEHIKAPQEVMEDGTLRRMSFTSVEVRP